MAVRPRMQSPSALQSTASDAYVAVISPTMPCFMPSIHAWFPASICRRAADAIGLLCARQVEQQSNKDTTINVLALSFAIGSFSPLGSRSAEATVLANL